MPGNHHFSTNPCGPENSLLPIVVVVYLLYAHYPVIMRTPSLLATSQCDVKNGLHTQHTSATPWYDVKN